MTGRISLTPEETGRQRRALLAVAVGAGLFAGVGSTAVAAVGLIWPGDWDSALIRWPADLALAGGYAWFLQYHLATVLLERTGLRLRRLMAATDRQSSKQMAWWYLAMAALVVSQLIVHLVSDRLFSPPDSGSHPMTLFLFMAAGMTMAADARVNRADWWEENDEPAGEEPRA